MVFQCRCGAAKWWEGKHRPPLCMACPRCGTGLAPENGFPLAPEPHTFSFVEEVETDEGLRPLTRCLYCLRTRYQLRTLP